MRSSEAIIREYLGELERRKYSPSTIAAWRNQLKLFLKHMRQNSLTRFQDVEETHITGYSRFLQERGLSANSKDSYLRAIRQFFRYLESAQQIFSNPAAKLVLRAPPRHILYVPSIEDINALSGRFDVASPIGLRDRSFLELIYSTGCRFNEAVGINVDDPDLERGTLRVMGKGSKERVVPLGEKAIFWLKLYIREGRSKLCRKGADTQAMWLSSDGNRTTGQTIQIAVRRHASSLGLKGFTIHALRRACATHMLQRGAHPVLIQELLGHANLQSLSQYLQVAITDLKKMHKRSKPGR